MSSSPESPPPSKPLTPTPRAGGQRRHAAQRIRQPRRPPRCSARQAPPPPRRTARGREGSPAIERPFAGSAAARMQRGSLVLTAGRAAAQAPPGQAGWGRRAAGAVAAAGRGAIHGRAWLLGNIHIRQRLPGWRVMTGGRRQRRGPAAGGNAAPKTRCQAAAHCTGHCAPGRGGPCAVREGGGQEQEARTRHSSVAATSGREGGRGGGRRRWLSPAISGREEGAGWPSQASSGREGRVCEGEHGGGGKADMWRHSKLPSVTCVLGVSPTPACGATANVLCHVFAGGGTICGWEVRRVTCASGGIC